jgi:hypothetical protein
MKRTIFALTILIGFFICPAKAQTKSQQMLKMKDSLTMVALSEYATRYPLLRQGILTTDLVGKTNIKTEIKGKDFYEAEMSISRVRSNFNIPLAHWGRNFVTGTISYQNARFESTNVKNLNSEYIFSDHSITKSTVGLTLSFNRSDSIFNHPISYGGSLSGVTDEFSSIKRVNYLGTVTVPVNRSKNSSLTLGLVVIINPSAVTPVIPIISYWHKYASSSLELFVDLPSRIALRKQLSKRSWIFAGSELGGNLFFFDLNQPLLPQSTTFSSIEIKTGATIEYLATKKLVLGLNGGLLTTASPRMFEQDDKPTAYFLKGNNSSAPYISFSVSFLPFLRK